MLNDMFGLFNNASKEKLAKIVRKKYKKEWDKSLRLCIKGAKQKANNGYQFFIIDSKVVHCPHNKGRPFEDVLNDIRKRFKGCDVNVDNTYGKTDIKVSWNIDRGNI